MLNNISFTDYINDSIRILVIAYIVNGKKAIKLTENRIKLFDYYLKFPKTMFSEINMDDNIRENFDEYYAFFHWQPDLIRYRRTINYLLAKGLLCNIIENNCLLYKITENGIDALNGMNSIHKNRQIKVANMLLENVVELSDSKIEAEIRQKTNMYRQLSREVNQ